MRMFFISHNYEELCRANPPWWKQFFFHGVGDRQDKAVGWVSRFYRPNDGQSRSPLIVERNTWSMPALFIADGQFVVSKSIKSKLAPLAPNIEFQRVCFRKLYNIPWGSSDVQLFPDDISESGLMGLVKNAQYSSDISVESYYEIISISTIDISRSPNAMLTGSLRRTRMMDFSSQVSSAVDCCIVAKYKAVYFCGGLLCTDDVAQLFASVVDDKWLAIDELKLSAGVESDPIK